MNTPTEVHYEPLELSDVTVHFGNIAFHVHSIILKKESKVLAVAVDGADNKECELTEACKKSGDSGHHCFTLSSPFGTTDVDEGQMKSFFDHMYDPAKKFEAHAHVAPIGRCRKPILFGATVHGTDYLDENRHVQRFEWSGGVVAGRNRSLLEVTKDGIIYSVNPSIVSQATTGAGATPIKSSQPISLKQFLQASETVIRLCHFFDCSVFLRSFQSYIDGLLIDSAVFKQPEEMFALLLLCDYCHFDVLVRPITV